jgi:glycosyltransferase involved in cell wall biosynthesis
MLIGIDASRAAADKPTGTEVYSTKLIQAMLELGASHRFRLYFRSPPATHGFPSAEICVISFPRLWTHVRLALEVTRRPPDVLFVPAHVLPLLRPRASIVTVHDLGYLFFPEAHPPLQRLYLDASTRWSARVAGAVVVDSHATKHDLQRRYGVPPGKVTVAYPGFDDALSPVEDAHPRLEIQSKYDLQPDYFLYLGTIQPRKNLARLVTAYAQCVSSLGLDHAPQLVLAGKRGWMAPDILRQVHRLGLSQLVRLVGYVPYEDKAALFSGALAFVFPSLYEGFGLPVLEAQACGCPVITSSTSSLPEAAGDGAALVNPEDTDAITATLRVAATDPHWRARLVDRGFDNLKRFSWHQCAERVLAEIETRWGTKAGNPVV